MGLPVQVRVPFPTVAEVDVPVYPLPVLVTVIEDTALLVTFTVAVAPVPARTVERS